MFNRKGKEEITFKEIFEEARMIKTAEEANQYLSSWVYYIWKNHNPQRKLIKVILKECRDRLGYYAGYYDRDTRLQMETMYGAIHPIIGSVLDTDKMSSKEIFDLGYALGEKMKQEVELV